jgi:hypothetical protein
MVVPDRVVHLPAEPGTGRARAARWEMAAQRERAHSFLARQSCRAKNSEPPSSEP